MAGAWGGACLCELLCGDALPGWVGRAAGGPHGLPLPGHLVLLELRAGGQLDFAAPRPGVDGLADLDLNHFGDVVSAYPLHLLEPQHVELAEPVLQRCGYQPIRVNSGLVEPFAGLGAFCLGGVGHGRLAPGQPPRSHHSGAGVPEEQDDLRWRVVRCCTPHGFLYDDADTSGLLALSGSRPPGHPELPVLWHRRQAHDRHPQGARRRREVPVCQCPDADRARATAPVRHLQDGEAVSGVLGDFSPLQLQAKRLQSGRLSSGGYGAKGVCPRFQAPAHQAAGSESHHGRPCQKPGRFNRAGASWKMVG
mmetsp:Transcript_12396/g.29304  ORF Transcript_12396/g.29304 Transcript_12396/m.29304 type:complete len:308 (-) Transcript_12396:363-1286(-)